jgi:uncharacterized protein (TIGR02246 family)
VASESEEIIALERSALDRWITFDPQGYLDLYAPEITYFDPSQEKRTAGLAAMEALLAPIRSFQGAIEGARYEMIAPEVQRHGDLALLTFQLVNYGRVGGRPEGLLARWNATEVYRRMEGRWRIIHSHWSYTKPELRLAGP